VTQRPKLDAKKNATAKICLLVKATAYAHEWAVNTTKEA
jgi:hypothetical protein